jgi:uncharacterized protein (DUF433 family)
LPFTRIWSISRFNIRLSEHAAPAALLKSRVIHSAFFIHPSAFGFTARAVQQGFRDDCFVGHFPGLSAVKTRLAATIGRCHLGGMSNEQLLARITTDPNICHGKPCVRGLRYPVEFLLDLLSGEMTPEQILADYPDLEANDLRAAIAYGARLSRIKSIERVAA